MLKFMTGGKILMRKNEFLTIMDKTYKTLGIVLKQENWRESDRLFCIYTKDFGKLRLISIGAKKIKSKLNGHLSVPGIVDLMIARSRNVDKIASARLIKTWPLDLEVDYPWYCALVELLERSQPEGEPSASLWSLVVEILDLSLKADKRESKQMIFVFFCVQLVVLSGWLPDLFWCSGCRAKILGQTFFSLENNGLVCGNCQIKKIPIKEDLVKILRLFSEERRLKRNLVLTRSLLRASLSFVKIWLPALLEQDLPALRNLPE
jgi:DNA repair protein RecO (recombination protein O)